MKKATYRKNVVMQNAWAMFKNDGFELERFEFVDVEDVKEKTFSLCLRESWAEEKEFIDSKNAKMVDAETSEEAKAWDWACRKLGVQFDDVTAVQKMTWVDEMAKEAWPGTSVWSLAMRAVKLHIEIAPSLVA